MWELAWEQGPEGRGSPRTPCRAPASPEQDFVMRQRDQPSLRSPCSPDATSKWGGSPRGGPGPWCPLLPSQHWSPVRPTDPALPSSGKEGGLAERRDRGGGGPPERRCPGPVAPECGGQSLGPVESGAQEGALGSARTVEGGVVTPEIQYPQQ